MLVFLVGYMGSGKSTIGRRLAAQAGFAFMDTDKQIEERYGATVREIFEKEGEARFRNLERQTLESLACSPGNTIVATGGGMPCSGDNIELMNRLGMTAYLKFSPENLVPRLAGGRDKRPIIRGMDDAQLLRFIKTNLAERELCYGQAAVVIDCNGASDDYICRHISECIAWYVKQK